MAAAVRMQFQVPSKASVRMLPDGTAVVRSDITDIGTGTYTIVAQVAAETLGIPLERVRVEIGDSDFPAGAGSGGSFGATNTCTAVYNACLALQAKLKKGKVPARGVEAEGAIGYMGTDPNYKNFSIHTYGAHFAEVGVDADTAEIRLRRMLGVFSVGRVFNAKTARSQLIGGMIFGVASALMEEMVPDTRTGQFVNHDLAGYLVPVHADIPEIDAVLLDGFDDKANVLGAKGAGELGNCGANAAVANAVFNATGVRVRDFPITIEKVLPALPLLAT
jgi:xanthine dehydrogenase YagR molybdenum-binding subunit